MTELHEQRSEADMVSDCVHCGFCLPTCPTYRLWGEEADSPRGRILLMGARLDGTVELTDTTVERFDRCLGCMACLSACPSGVQYDALIELTREHVEQEHRRSFTDRLLRTLIFQTFPNPRRLRVALALAPLGKVLPMPRAFRPLVALTPVLPQPGGAGASHAGAGRGASPAWGCCSAACSARSSATSTPRRRACSPPTASRSSPRSSRGAAARSRSTRAGARTAARARAR